MPLENFYFWFIPLIIWSAIWKGIALWKSARSNQLTWFIFILVLNTAGILPIIYLGFFQKKSNKISVKHERKNKRTKGR